MKITVISEIETMYGVPHRSRIRVEVGDDEEFTTPWKREDLSPTTERGVVDALRKKYPRATITRRSITRSFKPPKSG